jgi:hypothetical protein
MFIVSSFFLRFFTNNFAAAITLWPFVIVKNRQQLQEPVLRNHERIHLRQQAEMLVIPFYAWYVTEFCWQYVRCGQWSKAYYRISFEREAYLNEHKPHYLQQRKPYAFLAYLFKTAN